MHELRFSPPRHICHRHVSRARQARGDRVAPLTERQNRCAAHVKEGVALGLPRQFQGLAKLAREMTSSGSTFRHHRIIEARVISYRCALSSLLLTYLYFQSKFLPSHSLLMDTIYRTTNPKALTSKNGGPVSQLCCQYELRPTPLERGE